MANEYRIKQCARAGDEYGNCERCGKPCNPHYKQQYRKIGQLRAGWIAAGYGHVDCLRNLKWENAEVVDANDEVLQSASS